MAGRDRLAVLAVAALGALTFAMPADAAVNQPPVLPHNIIVFPQRDFVSAGGFEVGHAVTVEVIRNGITIGNSTVVDPAADGMVEINHPGGGCWITSTPDILPGDVIQTTQADTGIQDATTTADVTIERPINPVAGQIVVHGTAADAAGNPLPLAQIEQRLVSGDLFDSGKRTLRAAAAGADGTLTYDAPGSIHFTATYDGLSANDVGIAMGAESRALWLGANPGTGQELTIYENPGGPGPTPGCAAPLATNAIVSTDHLYNGQPTINRDNVDSDLTLTGVAQPEAVSLTVTLSDGSGGSTTAGLLLPPSVGGKTWSVTIPAAQLGALADGTLTATSSYTLPTGTIAGTGDLQLHKDTVAPPAPTATPGTGTYTTAPDPVVLDDADASALIHFTTNGTTPTPASPQYTGPIAIATSKTIAAIAVDAAGNQNSGSTTIATYTLVAKAQLSSTKLPFGAVADSLPVKLTNVGLATMTADAAITGTNPNANPADFSLSGTCSGATLAPGEFCTATVSFDPTLDGGPLAATLSFTDSASGSPHNVDLTGTGTGAITPAAAPAVSFVPTNVSFDAQNTGTTSATPQQLQVKNTGDAPLNITAVSATGADAAQFLVADGNCIGTIAPSSSCHVDVQFAPTSTGAKAAAVQITDDAAASPQTAPIRGTAVAAKATLTPAGLSFGAQKFGTASASRALVLQNTGSAPLTLGTPTLAGAGAGDFVKSIDGCDGETLAPSASCTVRVRFAPAATGASAATLSFPSDAPGATPSAALTGTGAATAATAPVASTTANVAFADQPVLAPAAPSPTQPVTVTNTGNANLQVSGVTVTGADAADFVKGSDGCAGTTLAPGATCAIQVAFAPATLGAKSASLAVADTATGSPQTTTLAGNGVAATPVVALTATGMSFGDRMTGSTSAVKTATVKNTGNAGLTIGAVTINGPDADQFAKGADGCAATTLAPGASCDVQMTFQPTTAGAKSGSLTIADDAGGPHVVALTGTGIAPDPAVVAPTGDPAAATATAVPAGPLSSPLRATPAPALSALQSAAKVKRSKARKAGLSLTMTLGDAVKMLRVRVQSKVKGKLRTVYATTVDVSISGPCKVKLREAALRRALTAGLYEIDVTAARSASDPGQPAAVFMRVTRG